MDAIFTTGSVLARWRVHAAAPRPGCTPIAPDPQHMATGAILAEHKPDQARALHGRSASIRTGERQ